MSIENAMTPEEAKKLEKKLDREKHEIMFAGQLDAEGFYPGEDPDNLMAGEYVREFKWHPKRRWRADFLIACEDKEYNTKLILVELHGATHARGGHTLGVGFQNDRIKYNTATAMGWAVYEFPGTMVEDGSAIEFLETEVWNAG